jgi:hypothetical protein
MQSLAGEYGIRSIGHVGNDIKAVRHEYVSELLPGFPVAIRDKDGGLGGIGSAWFTQVDGDVELFSTNGAMGCPQGMLG